VPFVSPFRSHSFLLCALLAPSAFAQVSPEIADQQLQRQQQRERAQQEQAAQQPNVRLPRQPATAMEYPEDESPCFPIRSIALDGTDAAKFKWALKAADPAIGRCLGSAGINVLLAKVQNALVAEGYVTTRVLAAPQDLRSGNLRLNVVTGRIRNIRFAEDYPRAAYRAALPSRSGDILNLRDIEQALENFKRIPGADADIQIVPGDQPGESDLMIQWKEGRRLRLSAAADDSGSDATGKWQGTATVSLDNPLQRNDLFYLSLSHDLPDGGGQGRHGTKGWGLHYSVPYGYWLMALQVNDYRYRQTVAGALQDYLYSGTSRNSELKVTRLVYRDGNRKTSISLRAYQRRSRNFIDDTEVEVQRRVMGGYGLGIAHKEFIGAATLDASLAWKQGVSSLGTLPAPEELFGEGTARPRIINADLSLQFPLTQTLNFQSTLRGQWDRTPLIPQDRFAIGGRYTVRGFDGEASLSAERGWLMRNDLTMNLGGPAGQVYAGIDHGQVSGPGADLLLGRSLAGAAIGWRGQLAGLQCDIFLGKPLRKPRGFNTASTTGAINLSYDY